MEENKLTAEDFLKSLKEIWWRIKKDNQWYELRVAKSIYDLPFVDQDGELFGVKNAKINFFVFKTDTDEIADWSQDILKREYLSLNLAKLPDNEVEVTFGITYAKNFILDILHHGDYLVLTSDGHKVEDWCSDPNAVY